MWRWGLAVAVGGLLWSGAGRASPFDVYGFGARGAAMGGALVAAAEDFHAIYYNPAQLMARPAVHVGSGVTWVEPRLFVSRATESPGTETVLPGRNVGWFFGASTPLGGVFRRRLAVGAAFFTPFLRVTRAEFLLGLPVGRAAVVDYLHGEPQRPPGNGPPDPSQAHNAQRCAFWHAEGRAFHGFDIS